jgi:hypothetical protein
MKRKNEVSITMDVSQRKLIRDRGQMSQEIQYIVRYYIKVFMSNGYEDNFLGSLLPKSEDCMRQSTNFL